MSYDVLMQYLPFVTGAAVLILLVFLVRHSNEQDRQDNTKLSAIWDKLNSEILEVSMLVSKNCPDNKEAHEAVIEAAKRLVYPKVSGRALVTTGMVESRYQKGVEFVQTARKLAGGDSQ